MYEVGKFSKYCLADRSMSVPVTLSDLEGRDAKGPTFPGDLITRQPFEQQRANSE